MDKQQEFKWRTHRRNKRRITVWVICVIVLSAAAAFIYEGTYDGNPQKVAERYIETQKKVTDYEVTAGERTINNDGSLEQRFTFSYTPGDAKEPITEIYDLTRQTKKRYSLFERWTLTKHVEEVKDFEVTAPKDAKVYLDGKQLEKDIIKEDKELSPGAVCYVVPTLEKREYQLQVAGLPFENYETKVNPEQEKIDVRSSLKLSENAKTQIQEQAKQAINKLFMAAYNDLAVKELGDVFAQVKEKETLLSTMKENLYADTDLKLESITFSGFKTTCSEPAYPKSGEEAVVSVEVKTTYNCEYKGMRKIYDEYGNDTGETKEEKKSQSQEAKLSVIYQGGKCTIKSIEVPKIF